MHSKQHAIFLSVSLSHGVLMNAQGLSLNRQVMQACFLRLPFIVYPKNAMQIPQFIPHGAMSSGVN